jgi:hypothetical protein
MVTYTGACHCGTVRYRVSLNEIKEAMECNCTHCERVGLLLAFVPRKHYVLESGDDNLSEYLFNTKKIRHQFCKTCGIEPFAFGTAKDGSPMVSINVRTIDGIDLKTNVKKPFDGRSW